MTQHITVEEVKAACRIAYAEKRLLAQNTVFQSSYGYLRDGRVCAIGAALTDETMKLVEQFGLHRTSISDGEELRKAFTWDDAEEEELMLIQISHDCWLQEDSGYRYALYEKDFRKRVGIKS